jgi:G3E family GTPase
MGKRRNKKKKEGEGGTKRPHHNKEQGSRKKQKMDHSKELKQSRKEIAEMLDSLMEADQPMPIPVVLMNSLTTKCGRKTLIQQIIKSRQSLIVAFVLSSSVASKLPKAKNKDLGYMVFSVDSSEKRLEKIIEIGTHRDCPFDCIVTDVNTVHDLELLFKFFEKESEEEQVNSDYISPIFLDSVISIANAHFLAKYLANVKDIRSEQSKLTFSLEMSNIILLNFVDAIDHRTIDFVMSKLEIINQIERSSVYETSFCEIEPFHILGTRSIDAELFDRYNRESKKFSKNEKLAIENNLPIPERTIIPLAPKSKLEPPPAIKHKNAQQFSSLSQAKDVKKKHLTIINRSDSEVLKRVEHFLENLVITYSSFPTIEIDKVPVADIGLFVQEHLTQLLLMIYYGEDYGELESKKEEEDEKEDYMDTQKQKMDPEFFLKLHSKDMNAWITDISQCAAFFAKQFNNKKTVKLTIKASSEPSNVVSHYEDRVLFVSYLGNGIRWRRPEEPNNEIIIPKYSIGIRAKGSNIEYEDISTAPYGFRVVMLIQ